MINSQTLVTITLIMNLFCLQVKINSMGLEYSAISLLSTLLMLYLTFWFNKFKLDAAVGRACLAMYAVFLVLATLIELNVFFPVNVRTCKRTVPKP